MWICCKQITDFLFIYSLFTFVWWIFSLNSSRAVAHSCTIHHEYLKCGIQTIFLTAAVWYHIKTFPIYKYLLTFKKKPIRLILVSILICLTMILVSLLICLAISHKNTKGETSCRLMFVGKRCERWRCLPAEGGVRPRSDLPHTDTEIFGTASPPLSIHPGANTSGGSGRVGYIILQWGSEGSSLSWAAGHE